MTTFQSIQQAVTAMGFAAMTQVFRFSVTDVPAVVFEWITAHPGQTVLLVVNGVVIFTPAALTGPLIASMGWGASGPVAGEFFRTCGSQKDRFSNQIRLRRGFASVDARECWGRGRLRILAECSDGGVWGCCC